MRVEIGGGPAPRHPDYTQIDLINWHERTGLQYLIADARALPLEDDTVEAIYASNILEHVSFLETDKTLREWRRVLKPDGLLTVVVPDLLGIYADYTAGTNPWPEFVERVYGSQTYELDLHRAGFTLEHFPPVLERNGFEILDIGQSHAGGGITAVAKPKQ